MRIHILREWDVRLLPLSAMLRIWMVPVFRCTCMPVPVPLPLPGSVNVFVFVWAVCVSERIYAISHFQYNRTIFSHSHALCFLVLLVLAGWLALSVIVVVVMFPYFQHLLQCICTICYAVCAYTWKVKLKHRVNLCSYERIPKTIHRSFAQNNNSWSTMQCAFEIKFVVKTWMKKLTACSICRRHTKRRCNFMCICVSCVYLIVEKTTISRVLRRTAYNRLVLCYPFYLSTGLSTSLPVIQNIWTASTIGLLFWWKNEWVNEWMNEWINEWKTLTLECQYSFSSSNHSYQLTAAKNSTNISAHHCSFRD